MNIITLSSIPPRFDNIGPTLDSLTKQTARIDKVLLYIPRSYRRFPDYDGRLPNVPADVEIRIVDEDLGPASKVLFALKDYWGQDANILFADDDRIYQDYWAQALLDVARNHPGCAAAISAFDIEYAGAAPYPRQDLPRVVFDIKNRDIAYRLRRLVQQLDFFRLFTPRHKPGRRNVRKSGYADIFEGIGGVLIRPEFFDRQVFEIPEAIWAVDDVWLSGHIARKGIKIWATADVLMSCQTDQHFVSPLFGAVIDGMDRPQANLAAIRYFQTTYGIWT